jgi:lysophospholipase L1-like esterase
MNSHRVLTIVIVLLAAGLIVSLTGNYLLFRQGEQYYHELNLTRLDPLGLGVYPIQTVENSEKLRVVFFGDSRAYQWPAPAGLERFEFINRGIGAQTSTQAVERFDEHVLSLQPDVVLIQMCINDLKTIPLFPELRSSIIATCKDNIERSVQEIKRQGGTVILTTVFPLGKLPVERTLFWSDAVDEAVREVNEFIASLEGEKVIIFDTGKVLAGETGLVRSEYSLDFLHLNQTGYEALNEALVNILKNLE